MNPPRLGMWPEWSFVATHMVCAMTDTDILILAFWILFWTVIALIAIGFAGFCALMVWIGRRMIASVSENSDEEYHLDHRHA